MSIGDHQQHPAKPAADQIGAGRQAEAAARKEEYRRSATSAIGDALREAGITPLTNAESADCEGGTSAF
jgi:hypothetical protein